MTGKMVNDAERDVDIDTLADRHLELSGDFNEVLDAAIDDQEDMGRIDPEDRNGGRLDRPIQARVLKS